MFDDNSSEIGAIGGLRPFEPSAGAAAPQAPAFQATPAQRPQAAEGGSAGDRVVSDSVKLSDDAQEMSTRGFQRSETLLASNLGHKPSHETQGAPRPKSTASNPSQKPAAPQAQAAQRAAEAKKVDAEQKRRARDQEMLARAIAAEARGESYPAQVGVASTIANHAKEKGRNIPSLVRSSFLSSNFDGNRKFYTMPTSRIPNYEQFHRAAGEALDGKQPITKDHIYFTDDRVRSTPWTDPRGVIVIGRMRFYKERPQ